MNTPHVRLKELCEVITKGTTPTSLGFDFSNNGVGFLRVQNVSGGKVNFERDTLFINEQVHHELRRSQILPGDVLLSIAGTIGRTGVVPENAPPLNCNQAIAIVRPTGKVFRSYLRHWLESNDAKSQMRGSTVTGTIQNLSLAQVGSLKVPLPPLSEQIRIAAILDQADELRVKRREAMAQLDSLTQSMFIEMFGDPRENEKGWTKQSIGAFISDMRGGASLEPDDFVESGFPILHKGAIKPQGQIHLDTKKKTFVATEYTIAKPGCVANREFVAVTLRDLVPSGPSIGLAADLRDGPFDEYILAQGAYAFRIDPAKVTTEYFVHLSNMPTFRYVLLQNAVGSTQIHIRTPIYLAISVPCPPIELQRKFSQRVRAVENMRRQYRVSLTELDSLFASLQYRTFRGEL